jgi:radical SAM superfamily enzyme YgiQ (UPF0313 family)
MKMLFQEPLVSSSVTYGKFAGGAGNNTFPYGLASVARYVMDRGHQVEYLEPNIEGMDFDAYGRYLRSRDVMLVGISSTTLQIKRAIATFEFIKKTRPELVTVLGGVHASLMPRETMEATKAIDYLVLGEGEVPFTRLLDALDGAGGVDRIPGLAFRGPSVIVVNPPARENSLEGGDLPVPPYELFPMRKYIAQVSFTKRFPSYSIVASRGCPFRCSFCNGNAVTGTRVRYKSIPVLLDEIELLKNEYGAKGIFFLDSTFTVNKGWLTEFCHKYIERKLGLHWACNSRVDTVDEALLRLMKAAGCWEVVYGVESGNQKSLDLICKGTTVEQGTKIVKLTKSLGFYTYTSYILCLPDETEEDALNTVSYAKELATPIAIFYLPVPFPKSGLHEICRQKGGLRENADWEDYNSWDFTNPVYINPLIGKEKMQKILKDAYSSYYLAPGIIAANLKELALLRQDPRKFVYALKGVLGLYK